MAAAVVCARPRASLQGLVKDRWPCCGWPESIDLDYNECHMMPQLSDHDTWAATSELSACPMVPQNSLALSSAYIHRVPRLARPPMGDMVLVEASPPEVREGGKRLLFGGPR